MNATTNATSRQLTPVQKAGQYLASSDFIGKARVALPPGVSPERFQRVVLTAIQQNPGCVGNDVNALYNAALRAAADGLLPDGREGAFVVMGGKTTWMPMVGGIIKRLAGAGISIDAQVVYENDEFEQELGDDARITHRAPKLGTARGKPLGVYAIAKTRDGMVFREVMDIEQVEQVRKASRSANAGPWKDWWTEMARKTVIRRLSKRLPITDAAVMETIARDDEHYDFDRETGEVRTGAAAAVNAAVRGQQPASEPGAIDGDFAVVADAESAGDGENDRGDAPSQPQDF